MLAGVINRQFKCINIDPYANAFNMNSEGGEWMSDLTDMKPELHERKWEIDSLLPDPPGIPLLENNGRCQRILRRMAAGHCKCAEDFQGTAA